MEINKDAMYEKMNHDIFDVLDVFADKFEEAGMSGMAQLVLLSQITDAAKQAYEKGYENGFEYAKQEQTLQSMMA